MNDILRPILELLIVFPGTVLAYLPMKNHLRYKRIKVMWGMSAFILALCFLGGIGCFYFGYSTKWMLVLIVVLTSYVYLQTLNISYWKSLNVVLAVCAVYACLMNVARGADFLISPMNTSLYLSIKAGLLNLFMAILFSVIAAYPSTLAVASLLEDEHIAQTWYIFWLLPVAFIGINYFMIHIYPKASYPATLLYGYIIICLFLLVVLGLFYTSFFFMCKNLNNIHKLWEENQFLSLERAQYNSLQSAIEEARHYRHDLRHHLTVLGGLVQQEDIKGIKSYLIEIGSGLTTKEMTFCSNLAIDSILVFYAGMYKEHNIPYKFKIDIPDKLMISEMDLCTILANLLENALDASNEMSIEKRYVHVQLWQHSSHIILIKVENYYDGELVERDGVIQSSKRKGPGVGLQSVNRIAKKNEGYCRVLHENQIFVAQVMLRVK